MGKKKIGIAEMCIRDRNKKEEAAEELRAQQEYLLEMGGVFSTKGKHAIHCLTVIGQIEGHSLAPQSQKTTKYEHVIPQLVAVEEDPAIEGLLVILNTVGGDVEAGLCLAELIAGVSKPSATLVLGGGHSIGIPLAVSAQRSFIVPSATMTVHPAVSYTHLDVYKRQSLLCWSTPLISSLAWSLSRCWRSTHPALPLRCCCLPLRARW